MKQLNVTEATTINIELTPATIEIEGAEVIGSITENTKSADLGRANVNVATIKKLPALMGEVDVLKVIQLLPGIQSSGEGNSGFYVRGGGPDQNLILLDNAPVYNASHLFGFFSVFNADAIQNVDVHKGLRLLVTVDALAPYSISAFAKEIERKQRLMAASLYQFKAYC